MLDIESDPYSMFIFAMNAPQTREKYVTRLKRFFDFIDLPGSNIEDRCHKFAEKGKADSRWVLSNILQFLHAQKARVERKEITGATLRNYVKTIKLFCEMNDILIPWKKITRGLPKGRKYADDRAPSLEEIQRIIEYPDRIMEDALWTQRLRNKLEPGKRRHEFQTDHGFRKWFKTRCEIAGMNQLTLKN